MGQQLLDTTAGAGDTAKAGGDKINSNFAQLFAQVFKPVAGKWVAAVSSGATISAGANSSSSMWLYPFVVTEEVTISDLGMRVATVGAGVTGMLGIYAHSLTTGHATGVALASVTGLSMASAAAVSATLPSNVTLQPGIYWAAFQASGATAAATFWASGETSQIALVSGGDTLSELFSGTNTLMQLKGIANTFGTFPDLTGASFTVTATRNGALLAYKVA
jgi:hypothetical protein